MPRRNSSKVSIVVDEKSWKSASTLAYFQVKNSIRIRTQRKSHWNRKKNLKPVQLSIRTADDVHIKCQSVNTSKTT